MLDWVVISPRDLPDPGIKPRSLSLQADFLLSEPFDLAIPCCWMFTGQRSGGQSLDSEVTYTPGSYPDSSVQLP